MLGGFFFIAIATIMSLSVAVVWHRFISVYDIPRAVVPVFHAKSVVVYFRQLVPLGLASGLAVDLMFLLVWIFYTLDQRALIISYLKLSVVYALIFTVRSLG